MTDLQTIDHFDYHEFRICWCHGAIPDHLAADIIDFWRRNKAIGRDAEVQRRVAEVACVILNPTGQVVGVNTVYRGDLPEAGNVYWLYRTFIQPDSRVGGLTIRVMRFTFEKLRSAYRADRSQPRGIGVVAENRKLHRPGMRRYMQRNGMRFLGKRNIREVWCIDFDPEPESD